MSFFALWWGARSKGPYARASHMLTGKCKTRANFDRLVSNKTFWNAISVPVLFRMFLVSRNFEDKCLAEKFKFIAHPETALALGIGERPAWPVLS
ncbi:MAG: hypothetical protein DMG38_15040 [Acidobacteria bacterium]|nr:MAG: hypothetical protein DMG38_15040 [Acidobacteriota bacterium]